MAAEPVAHDREGAVQIPNLAVLCHVRVLRRSGRLVFLDRSPEKLIATADRPLASDREALRRRYEERYDLYCAAADLHIDGDGTVEETAQRIEKEWMK